MHTISVVKHGEDEEKKNRAQSSHFLWHSKNVYNGAADNKVSPGHCNCARHRSYGIVNKRAYARAYAVHNNRYICLSIYHVVLYMLNIC